MGHRLSKIMTRTGDRGTTGLADGSRVPKNSPRIEAIGSVDELNSVIGTLLAEDLPDEIRACLGDVQNDLFDLGGELSVSLRPIMSATHVARLESLIRSFNACLPPLKEFILPGGSKAAALTHVARTVCRRAERRVVSLHGTDHKFPFVLKYLNRLSDLLFVLSRVLNRLAGTPEVMWRPRKPPKTRPG